MLVGLGPVPGLTMKGLTSCSIKWLRLRERTQSKMARRATTAMIDPRVEGQPRPSGSHSRSRLDRDGAATLYEKAMEYREANPSPCPAGVVLKNGSPNNPVSRTATNKRRLSN